MVFNNVTLVPEVHNILGRELYSHVGDTSLWLDFPGENVNLAQEPAHSGKHSCLRAKGAFSRKEWDGSWEGGGYTCLPFGAFKEQMKAADGTGPT